MGNRQSVNKFGRILITVLIFSVWFPAGSLFCAAGSPRKASIMTSVFPLLEFARAVAGEEAEVKLLLPPGAGVHTWQPRPSDLGKLYASDLFIFIGSRLEPWAQDIIKSLSGRKVRVLEVSGFLTLMESGKEGHEQEAGHGVFDPHVWLDFEYDQTIVRRIGETLSELVPAAAATFRTNAESYIEKLKTMDELYRKDLGSCPLRTFIVGGHAAFGYLARRYNLKQISLYGLSPDAEPTPNQMIEVINLSRKEGLRVVFFESNVNPKLAKVLAKEIQAKTLTLNPGHNLSKEEIAAGMTFLRLMEQNLKALKEGLGCE